jgi:hypothetical protein
MTKSSVMRVTAEEAEERLTERLEKVEALINDPNALAGERSAAEAKAAKLRLQLAELRNEDAAAYRKLVEQGRTAASSLWTLGDLACRVEKDYGGSRLEQYADDIGVPYATLRAARATARAWPEKVRRLTFSASQALNTLPDRVVLASARPDMTTAEAREIAKARRGPRPPRKPPKASEPPPPPDRDDVGVDSAGEAARLRARNDKLEREKNRLEALASRLQDRIDDAFADLEPDVRSFVDDLVARVAGMTTEQREELFRALRRVLGDFSKPPLDDGLDIPESLRRTS